MPTIAASALITAITTAAKAMAGAAIGMADIGGMAGDTGKTEITPPIIANREMRLII